MSALERDVVRFLRRSAGERDIALSATVTRERDWASALFIGTRLTVELAADDDRDIFDQWLADLPDAEMPLRGHFVADAEVTARRAGSATVELLAIEES